MSQSYATPLAFRQALEQRLRNQAADGSRLSRARQLLVFERYLARLSKVLGDSVILKGGLVLELRLESARTTKDIDLRLTGSAAEALASLQRAARLDLGDFLSFEVAPDARHPVIAGDGVKYEGRSTLGHGTDIRLSRHARTSVRCTAAAEKLGDSLFGNG